MLAVTALEQSRALHIGARGGGADEPPGEVRCRVHRACGNSFDVDVDTQSRVAPVVSDAKQAIAELLAIEARDCLLYGLGEEELLQDHIGLSTLIAPGGSSADVFCMEGKTSAVDFAHIEGFGHIEGRGRLALAGKRGVPAQPYLLDFAREGGSGITRLKCCSNISLTGVGIAVLSEFTSLMDLTLAACGLGPRQTELLLATLGDTTSLTCLDIANNVRA
jgi:hypothetical protein